MDRRTFLRQSVVVTSSLTLAPFVPTSFVANASAAPRLSWVPGRQALRSFGKFVGAAVKEGVGEFITQGTKEGLAALLALGETKPTPYIETRDSTVHVWNTNVFSFAITDPDTLDAQVPVIQPPAGRECPYCFIGGPSLPLLAQTALELRRAYPRMQPVHVGTYLMPTAKTERNVTWLTYDQEWWAKYWTHAGYIAMSYVPNRAPTASAFGTGIATIDVMEATAQRGRYKRIMQQQFELPRVY